jgi:invasion protein IalB
MSHRLILSAFLLLVGLSAPAYAQAPAAPAVPAPAKPAPAKPKPIKFGQTQIISSDFGAWALRCQEGSQGPTRVCEISQTIEDKKQSGPIAKISVGRPRAGGDLHVAIILPNNVSFPSSVHLRTEENDKWGLELQWVRCIPGACLADAPLADATVAHWRGLSTAGNIVFTDAAGDEVSLPMSFDGFGKAFDALNK